MILQNIKYRFLWFVWILKVYYARWYYYYFPVPKIKTENEIIADSVKSDKERFLKKYDHIKNTAIDDIFYSKRKFHAKMKEANNEIEKAWKTRILIEYTKRGNIAMFYDAYKLGFSYYCDTTIPYDLLNTLCMKYVERFHCRDFFMDETIIPDGKSTPLMILINDEKKRDAESNKNSTNTDELKETLKKAPMAKLKNYNKVSTRVNENKKEGKATGTVGTEGTVGAAVGTEAGADTEKKVEVEKNTNRFIYVGKFYQFNVLQTPPKQGVNLFEKDSNMITGLFGNASVQKEVFSYRDFKNTKKI
jgi:hypothetical protein